MMRERISELKEAAMEVVFLSPSTGREQKELNIDKFAELIVRECIQAVDNAGGFNEEYHMNAIKQHFGVEQ